MLVGHFAVGLVAKRVEPKISLGTLVLAALLADFLWVIFLITGIEHLEFKPGRGAANYVAGGDIVWSHSLLMDVVWAALLAAGYFLKRRYRRGALVVFGAALTHWLLDFVSLAVPLAPDTGRYFGLGLVFRTRYDCRGRRFLAVRTGAVYARYDSQESSRQIRFLDCRCSPNLSLV